MKQIIIQIYLRDGRCKPVQCLKHLAGCQIQFIKYNPMPFPQCCYKCAFSKTETSLLICDVRSQIFLKVCAFMIVYSDTAVACFGCQVWYKGRLTTRCGTLQNKRNAKNNSTMICDRLLFYVIQASYMRITWHHMQDKSFVVSYKLILSILVVTISWRGWQWLCLILFKHFTTNTSHDQTKRYLNVKLLI